MIRAGIGLTMRSGADARGDIDAALEALTILAQREIESGRAPALWDAAERIRYQREPLRRVEDWQTPSQIIASGSGDCEDLAAYLAATLRAQGVRAAARVYPVDGGWHAVVFSGGRILDPSAALGMGGPLTQEVGRRRRFGGRLSRAAKKGWRFVKKTARSKKARKIFRIALDGAKRASSGYQRLYLEAAATALGVAAEEDGVENVETEAAELLRAADRARDGGETRRRVEAALDDVLDLAEEDRA